MDFSEIIGQQNIKKMFGRMIMERRVPHAMLLTGGKGVGKLPLALALGKRILCENAEGFESCSSCQSCLLADRLEHPDLHLIFPVIKLSESVTTCRYFTKEFRSAVLGNPYLSIEDWMATLSSENKRGQIYAQESEEIIENVYAHPYQGKMKVFVIWMAELMNEVCANKILKILEEPPLDTVFILVSDEPEKMLQTIRSRCLRVEIPTIGQDEMAEAIQNRYEVEDDQLRYMVKAANGSWNQLLQVVSQTENARLCFELFVEMMRIAWQFDMVKTREFSGRVGKMSRNFQLEFLANAQRLLRENFICHIGMDNLSYMNREESLFAAKFSQFIGEKNVLDIYELFALAERQIAQNVNSEIIIFHSIIKLYIYLHKKNG
ncbi:MAG: DNA polymerase III subunit delta [Paludibacteraceae bacterium]|nr:DNA polymerase III subunit delta [Paludibacteraceae bacterium]